MNVKDIIEGMADRAFKFSFLQGINDLYDSRDYGDTEPDYQTGFNHLMIILTDKQKEDLNRLEGAYTERRYFAAEYGFKCGLYGAFRQFFGCSGVRDGGFEDLVADDLLMQPKMQRHRSNYANIELCNKIDAEIMDLINPLVKVQCVDKILTMEYHLGYIKPYSEVERLRDMAA